MPKRRKNNVETAVEGGNAEQSRLSLSEAKTLFLRDIRLLSKETQRWHRENLTAVEKALVKQKIDVSDVRCLTAPMMKEHVVFYMFEEMELKPNTINGRVRSVRALTKLLFGEGHIDRDFGADIPFIKSEKVIIEAFSEDQIEALLRQPDRRKFTGLRDYTLMLLLLETGIRIAECIGIDIEDVRLKEGQILIHGKGAKQRLVPFQSKFRRALQRYLEVRGSAETDALFVTVEGERISKRYVQELIHDYGEMAHIRDVRVSPHTFRHTMAKYYILAGGDIFSLQKILGHSTLDMVRMYVDLFSSDVQMQHRKFSFLENHL
jgi:integrase/recombinase XerD